MDIIANLTTQLNNRPQNGPLLCSDVADMLTQAAHDTVMAAAVGNTVTDHLTPTQLGTILVALQWNANPAIRAGVKVRG